MVITIDPPLPCGQPQEDAWEPQRYCGRPATQAIITPLADDAWEMLPFCSTHLNEASRVDDDGPI